MTLRVAVVGCGGMGRAHMRELVATGEVEIVALCDASAAAVEAARQALRAGERIPGFADHAAMLARTRPDAVVIVSPHAHHYTQARDALAAGCHVLVEKPFVAEVSQAERLVEIARDRGLQLGVAYQRRGEPAFVRMREVVRAGRLGRLHFVTATLSQNWLRGSRGSWRQDPAMSCGGELNDSGSHVLDALLHLVGDEPVEVFARTDSLGSSVDVNAAVFVRFARGAQAVVSVVGHASHWSEELALWGDNGSMVLGPERRLVERVVDGAIGDPPASEVELGEATSVARNFVDALRWRAPLLCPGDEAARVVALTRAIYESAAAGVPISVGATAVRAGAAA